LPLSRAPARVDGRAHVHRRLDQLAHVEAQVLAVAVGPVGAASEGRPRNGLLSMAQQRLIRELVDSELAGELSIERMSALLGMSPFQFSRRFKSSFGVSAHQFVMQRRIEAAAAELRKHPARPIADIALDVGFSNQAHFTAAFRRHTGTTPARARWS
jgi:AraC-like DNA-binding protein